MKSVDSITKELMARTKDALALDVKGDPPLIAAIRDKKPARVQALLAMAQHGLLKLDVNQVSSNPDRQGMTALMLACKLGDAISVQDLCSDKKLKMNQVDRYGRSALWFAIEQGEPGVVSALLERKADPLNRGPGGKTLLIWAVEQARVDIVNLLLQIKGVLQQINFVDRKGNTALIYSIHLLDASITTCLVAIPGINPNTCNNDQHNACWLATKLQKPLHLRALLNAPLTPENDLDINNPGPGGDTPLHQVCQDEWKEGLTILLADERLDRTKANSNEKTVQMLCEEKGNAEFLALLEERGARPPI